MSFDVMLRELVAKLVREELAKRPTSGAPELVTAAEYGRRMSLSRTTVRKAIREGRLDVTRIGRAVRIAAAAQIDQPRRSGGGDDRIRRATEIALRKLRGG